MKMKYKFEKIDFDIPELPDEDKKKIHNYLKQIGYRMAMKMEHILEQVVRDNPIIPFEDMVLRYNLNHVPVDIITKDGVVLYDFKKEL